MLQLNSKQIAELKAYLGNYGLDVKPKSKPRKGRDEYASRIRAWRPETVEGRKVKSNLLYWHKVGPAKGITSYVRLVGWHRAKSDPAEIAEFYRNPIWNQYAISPCKCLSYRKTKVTTIHEREICK